MPLIVPTAGAFTRLRKPVVSSESVVAGAIVVAPLTLPGKVPEGLAVVELPV